MIDRDASRGLDDRSMAQLAAVVALVRDVVGPDALAAYLYGSAAGSGLRPDSDLDVFVVTARPTTDDERRRLVEGLLPLSGRRASRGPARSIELTGVAAADVRPWRYPARLDFQYGDWWRREFESGDLAPWTTPNPDLAILLRTLEKGARVLFGPPPDQLLDPVPDADLQRAMLETIPHLLADLPDDTRNVVLTLARIWTTLETGEIRSKDGAADWALERLPAEHRPVLERARDAYRGHREDWGDLAHRVDPHASHVVARIRERAAMSSAAGGGHGGERPEPSVREP